ncbi:MAG: NlpC/P60 family protein [Actinomycetota bacterium]
MPSTRRAVIAVAFVAAVSAGAVGHAAPRQERLEDAQGRLLELEKDFELTVERYNATREELLEIQAEMATTRLVVEEIESRMDERRADAIALATELYKTGFSTAALESILSSDTLAEVETRLTYLRSSEQAQAGVFERLEEDRSVLDASLARLENDRIEALAAEQRLAELRVEIEAKVVEQRDEVEELTAAIEEAQRRARLRAQRALGAFVSQTPNPAPATNPRAQTAVDAALSQLGKPYQWGAYGPDTYDCSGLTMWAWAQANVTLPHNSGLQYAATPRIDEAQWEPGDLLFFGDPIHHVGMYIGNGQMVEAPYTGAFVRVVSAFRPDYVGAGRPQP